MTNTPTLRRQMNRAFADFDRQFWVAAPPTSETRPFLSVDDAEDVLTLRADLPGFSTDDLEVGIDGKTLTLRGERNVDAPEGYEPIRRERGRVAFERSWTLPCRVDADGVEANLEAGVLTLVLPKTSEEKPRTIPVRSR